MSDLDERYRKIEPVQRKLMKLCEKEYTGKVVVNMQTGHIMSAKSDDVTIITKQRKNYA